MTSKLTSEILDDETLAELIAFRRSRVEYCQKEGLPYQKALHDSMMLALEELQERRKVERDTEPYGFTDGDRRGMIYKPEHSDRLSEPVPLYRHAQPAPVVPVVPDFKKLARELVDNLVDCGGLDEGVKEKYLKWAEKACRDAMLQAKSLTSINPAPALVSLPKNAKSLTGNSPVNGIDLASGPDRTVEVRYVAPPGYVMVPKEPTEAMMLHNSGCQHHAWDDPDCAMRQTRRLIWSHMLAAAPQEVK
ncbi:TPA: hypothetical protein ACHT1X_001050 [Klebsiella pneumoniae]